MRYRACLLVLPLLAGFSGCASAPNMHDCIPMGHDGQVCLLAPNELPALHATHFVVINRNGEEETFLGQLQIDNHALRLAATSLFGITLYSIVYDGNTIVSRPPRADLHADILVALLELSLADPAAFQNRLHNLVLKVSPGDHGQVRELFEHGHLIVRIELSGALLSEARINIVIPAYKISIRMTPIQDNTLQP